jgi:DNA topoisomerase-1
MAKNLIIIESPNKTQTIQKYLNNNYEIMATIGHIRDLSTKGGLGFDEKTLEPF